MTIDEKNAYIMKYINNIIKKLEEQGINFTEDQKREIFTKHLNSDKSLEEIQYEINEGENEDECLKVAEDSEEYKYE